MTKCKDCDREIERGLRSHYCQSCGVIRSLMLQNDILTRQLEELKVCVWKHIVDDGNDYWQAGCKPIGYISNAPFDINGQFPYCHHCGGKIKLA